MGSSASRDRTEGDTSELVSSHGPNGVHDDSVGADPTRVENGTGQMSLRAFERAGHTYTDNTIGDDSKAHFGDVYTQNFNYVLASSENESTVTSKARQNFMKALWFDQMSFRRSAIDPAYAETSRWVFDTPEFLRWRDPTILNPDHNIFWLKGKPGAGKSTIMRTLLEYLQEDDPDSIVLSFFFNARGQPLEQSVEGLYRTMLHQLLSENGSIFKAIEKHHAHVTGKSWTKETLRGLFYDAVLGLRQKRVLFLVDALDEGDEREVRSMIEFAKNLSRVADLKHISLAICFASRHYPSINVPGCEEVVVEDHRDHAQDIARYIRGTLNLGRELEKQILVDAIRAKARGVFLWVVLVVGILNAEYDHGATREQLFRTLRTTPAELNELLNNILRAGLSDKRLIPALLWVLFHVRERKLRVRELYFAIRWSIDDVVLNNCSCQPTKLGILRRYIVSASKGLMEIVYDWDERSSDCSGQDDHDSNDDGSEDDDTDDDDTDGDDADDDDPDGDDTDDDDPDGDDLDDNDSDDDEGYTIQFIHESVREHLLSGALADLRPELLPNVEASSHAMLAEWCQAYARKVLPACMPFYVSLATGILNVNKLDDDDVSAFKRTDAFSFFNYVIGATLQHLAIAHNGGTLYVDDLENFPTIQWINMKNIEVFILPGKTPWYLKSSASLLYFLVSERCGATAMALCEYYKTLPTLTPYGQAHSDRRKTKGSRWRHPLNAKSLNAACGGPYGSLLSAAAACETEDVVEFLLELGADLSNMVGRFDSPMYWAAFRGDPGVSRLLLDHGADINKHTKRCNAPLLVAAERGHVAVVQLLLERGADPNWVAPRLPGDDLRALRYWGEAGDPRVKQKYTPLYEAACAAKLEVCQLLLDHGASLEIPNRTRLLRDASFGYGNQATRAQVLQLLLDSSSHISAAELSMIMLCGPENPAQLEVLLRHGADPTSTDEHLRTALYMCVEQTVSVHSWVAESICLLLDFGASPNAVGGRYGTALIAASAGGKASFVKILLDHGADIGYRDETHGTAIEAARRNHHSDIEGTLRKESESRSYAMTQQPKETVTAFDLMRTIATKRDNLMDQELELD